MVWDSVNMRPMQWEEPWTKEFMEDNIPCGLPEEELVQSLTPCRQGHLCFNL